MLWMSDLLWTMWGTEVKRDVIGVTPCSQGHGGGGDKKQPKTPQTT